MPAAVLHGPWQAGQQTPLAAKRQEPVHVTVLVAFWCVCGLPYCLIWLATGLNGAEHAAPCHASSRPTSITLHWLVCWLARWPEEMSCVEVGESAR
jgi:hypothetical protein